MSIKPCFDFHFLVMVASQIVEYLCDSMEKARVYIRNVFKFCFFSFFNVSESFFLPFPLISQNHCSRNLCKISF